MNEVGAHGSRREEILIVEDNPASLKLLSAILTEAGYKARPATDGELALRSLQAKLPELILLDLKLPGMDGIEVCRRLKEDPAARDTPVIFVSAVEDAEFKVSALEAGAVDYVTKPIVPAEVLARIGTHLRIHRMQRDLAAKTEQLEKHRDHLEVLVEDRTAALRKSEARLRKTQKIDALLVMAGSIAHNFNNMLHAALGYAAMALDKIPHDSEVRELLAESEKATKRAAELSTLMLVYVGQGQGKQEQIRLSDLVRDSLQILRQSEQGRFSLSMDLEQESVSVKADPAQLHQLVANLFANAVEALSDDPGTVTISTRVARLSADELRETHLHEERPAGDYVILEVADSGCGMDDETLEKVLDPFFTTKFPGRGLGMAAVAGIVRGHQGAIAINSNPNQGTTVKILLPVSGKIKATVDEKPSISEERGSKASGTILLVDDEEMVRAVGAHMLNRLGYDVILACDGQEAIDVFRSRAGEIDCVLLDLTMPKIDGRQAFSELQRIRPDVKVILCSGHNEQEATRGFSGNGLAGFLRKPFGQLSLRAKLDAILRGDPLSSPEIPNDKVKGEPE